MINSRLIIIGVRLIIKLFNLDNTVVSKSKTIHRILRGSTSVASNGSGLGQGGNPS